MAASFFFGVFKLLWAIFNHQFFWIGLRVMVRIWVMVSIIVSVRVRVRRG